MSNVLTSWDTDIVQMSPQEGRLCTSIQNKLVGGSIVLDQGPSISVVQGPTCRAIKPDDWCVMWGHSWHEHVVWHRQVHVEWWRAIQVCALIRR